MPLSVGARPGVNNPGDITVAPGNPDQYAGQGQTGVYRAGTGLLFPSFSSPQAGFAALTDYLGRHVGATTTAADLAQTYDPGPAAAGWASQVAAALGISPNDPLLSHANLGQIGVAIEHAEGTFGTFGDLSGAADPNAAAHAGQTTSAADSASAAPSDFLGVVEGFFVRSGMILAGGAIITVALWQLLSNTGAVPSPAATAKGAAKVAGKAAGAALAA